MRPPPVGSVAHQAGGLKVLDDLVDGGDGLGQRSGGGQSAYRVGGPAGSGGPGGSGRGDVIRKVAITLENQGKIKKYNLSHYAKRRPWRPPGGVFAWR